METLAKPTAFEWDKGNLDKNWFKHKVEAKEAEQVFSNKPLKIYPDMSHSQKESRFF